MCSFFLVYFSLLVFSYGVSLCGAGVSFPSACSLLIFIPFRPLLWRSGVVVLCSSCFYTFCLINSAPPGKISIRPSPSPSSLPPAHPPSYCPLPSAAPSPPSRPLLNASPSFGINTFDQFRPAPGKISFLPPSFQGSFLDLIPYPFSLWSMDDNGVVRLGG